MAQEKPDARAERLKAALRANLRKRKEQVRGRSTPDRSPAAGDDTPRDRG